MKQEQTTPTKRPRQKLKAAKKGSMLCLLGFLPGRQVVLSRNILKNGHCVLQKYLLLSKIIDLDPLATVTFFHLFSLLSL